MSIWCQTIL